MSDILCTVAKQKAINKLLFLPVVPKSIEFLQSMDIILAELHPESSDEVMELLDSVMMNCASVVYVVEKWNQVFIF